MPYDMTNKTAGDEISSTYEGRHFEMTESLLVHPTHADGFVDKGDPVQLGNLVGVAFTSAVAATDLIAVDTEGIWALSVVAVDALGNSAVARGDRIYINRTTGVLSKIANPATNILFGIALSTLSTGTTGLVAVKVHQDPLGAEIDEGIIYVSPQGSDTYGNGSRCNPVKTLTKAVTLVTTTRKVVHLFPGEYAEAAPVAWPTIKGVVIKGEGINCTSVSATGACVISVTPGVQTSTFTGYLEGMEIAHDAGDAQSGIKFDNTGMTKKLNFGIKNVTFSPDETTDKSIDVATHDDADNAIRVYVSGDGAQSEIGGAIYFNVNNLADRLHIENCWVIGTITTPNVAKEFRMRLFKSILPTGAAVAGGNATQVVTAVCCYVWTDYDDITPEIYAALATGDLTGSHSEVIVA